MRKSFRKCLDKNPKTILVKFNGLLYPDTEFLLCSDCILRHPFNKQQKSEPIIKKDVEFLPQNPNRKTPDFEKGDSN